MFRIKLGDQLTFGNVSRGARVVVECDNINEVIDLITTGVAETFIAMEQESREDARATIKKL